MLTLECVRNKDRMAAEPIVQLLRPEVIEMLSKVSLVVHTMVPEKYRFWTSNRQGVAIWSGPLDLISRLVFSSLFFCDVVLC